MIGTKKFNWLRFEVKIYAQLWGKRMQTVKTSLWIIIEKRIGLSIVGDLKYAHGTNCRPIMSRIPWKESFAFLLYSKSIFCLEICLIKNVVCRNETRVEKKEFY